VPHKRRGSSIRTRAVPPRLPPWQTLAPLATRRSTEELEGPVGHRGARGIAEETLKIGRQALCRHCSEEDQKVDGNRHRKLIEMACRLPSPDLNRVSDEASPLKRFPKLGLWLQRARIDGDVAVCGELGDGQLSGAGMQIDCLCSHQDDCRSLIPQGLQDVEEGGSGQDILRIGSARHARSRPSRPRARRLRWGPDPGWSEGRPPPGLLRRTLPRCPSRLVDRQPDRMAQPR
jgi:hypothetical protein